MNIASNLIRYQTEETEQTGLRGRPVVEFHFHCGEPELIYFTNQIGYMSTAIKLDGAENVYLSNIQTAGFENGIIAEDSSGVIEGYQGDPISLRDGSEFQIVDSNPTGLEVTNSEAELHDSLAWTVLESTAGEQDPVIHELQYYADRVIDSRTPQEKRKWTERIKSRIQQSEPYLKWTGYGHLVWKLLQSFA